mgnify:FL=1
MYKYLLVILTFCYLGCEDSESNEPEPKVLSGLWEWRYYYDSEESSWFLYSGQPRNYPFNTWAFIDESSFRERILTDSLCYSDWNTFTDGHNGFRFQFIGEGSLSLMLNTEDDNPDNDNGVSFKAVEDSLYYTGNGLNGLSTLMYKAIRIDTLNFTPLCND